LKTKRVSPHVLRHYVGFLTMSGDAAGPVNLAANSRSERVAA
jgi:hypothetical protein